MSDVDPSVLELAKREYGENCELVKRTEWSYSFKCGPKSYCSISVERESEIGIPEDLFFGPIPYFPYLSTTGALFAITDSSEYEQAIRQYFDHPREQVRYWAEHALGIEGLTTTKRNAEYAKKRENR